MAFTLKKSIEILQRTPDVLHILLHGISDDWTQHNEGGDTWSVFDVIGHLIHGEKADWVTRAEIILSESPDKKFEPFDRLVQFEESKGKTLPQLLDEFKLLRKENIERLLSKNLTEKDFNKTGLHPAFGKVKLSQLLSTWVAHDLDHIAQITRVMAKQYKEDVGPWIEYLKILRQ
jgi:hypothetical protein